METLVRDDERGTDPPSHLRSLKSRLKHTLIHEWPAALFVAGLVGIAQAHVPWLKRVESSMLASVAQVGEWTGWATASDSRAWIYTIDRFDFQGRYKGRTPLDRCELKKDLLGIYTAIHQYNGRQALPATARGASHPSVIAALNERTAAHRIDLLVIDLDLAPIVPATADEARCQAELEDLLLRERNPKDGSIDPIRLIAMQPIDANDNTDTQAWLTRLKRQNILFGDARYPIREDMAVTYYCDPTSLAAQAYYAAGGSGDNCIDHTARRIREIKCKAECDDASAEYQDQIDQLKIEHQEFIDPVKYGNRIDFMSLRAEDAGADRQAVVLTTRPRHPVKAVFFGVALDADSSPTPMGVLSGVQINAATFLSLLDPISSEHHFVGFVIDLLVGLSFALIITLCWESFFERRTADDPTKRTLAGLWLIGLGLAGSAMLAFFMFGSAFALRHGVWFSPLPIALGMLFDAAVAGSVAYVIERDGRSHGPSNLRESVRDLLGGKLVELARKKHRAAAAVEAGYLAIWIAVVVFGIFPESLKGPITWLKGLFP